MSVTSAPAWEALQQVRERLETPRRELLEHPVYSRLNSLPALRIFMEYHVYAVWDFMSLLKSLQRELCCVSVPWLPVTQPAAARLINEIVLAEESDLDPQGNPASHFELYLRAMQEAEADTAPLETFLQALREGDAVAEAARTARVPLAAQEFLAETFAVLDQQDLPAIAAAFTFGREGLLPDLFTRIVAGLHQQAPGHLQQFRYYLDRHIELDGDEHGPLADQLLLTLCGEDASRWNRVESAARDALAARKTLWDGMLAEIDAL